MRIAWLAPPPWAPSGYGVQCKLFTDYLAAAGHDVAVLAFAGCHQHQRTAAGVEILPAGTKPYGNSLIGPLCKRWGAEALVILADGWGIEPGQLGQLGIPVYWWAPVDCDPLGVLDVMWLSNAKAAGADLRPVAMSGFGSRVLGEAGWPAPVISHALQPEMRPAVDRLAWGRAQGLPDDAFLFASILVNDNKEGRKAPDIILAAFAQHAAKYPDSWLYLHCEAANPAGFNLAYAARGLGLEHRVRFPPEAERAADLLGADWVAGMLGRADCYVQSSRAEGFGVGIIEALACGTPVIATRGSAMTELVRPESGKLISGQPELAPHHSSWWVTPSVRELAAAMGSMHGQAAMMRSAAARQAGRWTVAEHGQRWLELLARGNELELAADPAGLEISGPPDELIEDRGTGQGPEPEILLGRRFADI